MWVSILCKIYFLISTKPARLCAILGTKIRSDWTSITVLFFLTFICLIVLIYSSWAKHIIPHITNRKLTSVSGLDLWKRGQNFPGSHDSTFSSKRAGSFFSYEKWDLHFLKAMELYDHEYFCSILLGTCRMMCYKAPHVAASRLEAFSKPFLLCRWNDTIFIQITGPLVFFEKHMESYGH